MVHAVNTEKEQTLKQSTNNIFIYTLWYGNTRQRKKHCLSKEILSQQRIWH